MIQQTAQEIEFLLIKKNFFLLLKLFFQNKSVALVGNASSLLDQEYGKLIDDHDIVCRFNRGIPVYQQQGVKTDFLIYNNTPIIQDLNIPDDIIQIPQSYIHDNVQKVQRKLNLPKKTKPTLGLTFLDVVTSFPVHKISLFGFDWGETKTFYEEEFYNTTDKLIWKHNFAAEKMLIKDFYCKKFRIEIFK